jgi:hypothetical protein
MKKLLYLLCVPLLILASCSSDDSTTPAQPVLVKKIIETRSTGSITSVITYNGSKIVNITVSGINAGKTIFTYTGDLITKTEEFDDKDVLNYTIDYTYSNNKLANFIEQGTGDAIKYKTVYIHNSDGTVSYQASNINTTTNVETLGTTGKLTYVNGNLTKKEDFSSSGSTSTTTFEYDSKNSPTKNITGLSLLLDRDETLSVNNIIKTTETSSYSSNTYTSILTYNSANYVTEEKSANATTQYFYE